MSAAQDPTAEARILWDVVDEHFDEAEFLFEQWRVALDSPLYTFDELADTTERRLEAHIDGLAIAGDPAADRLLWPIIEGGEDGDDLGRVAAAALCYAQLPDRRRVDALIAHVGTLDDGARRGALAAGLSASDRADVSAKISAALQNEPDATGREHWLDVLAVRGGLPGSAAAQALSDPDPAIRCAAVRASRFAGRRAALAAAEPLLGDPDPRVQAAAGEVGTIFGSPAAWAAVLARASSPDPGDALVLAAVVGEPVHVEALVARTTDERTSRAAIWALGFSGRVAAADAMLELLSDAALGTLAAEAFAAITGLPTQEPYFVDAPTRPAHDDPDELDDDLDAELTDAPEDELPVPVPEEIARWWSTQRSDFRPGQRYLAGRPAQGVAYVEALAQTTVRRRHALSLEVSVRSRGTEYVPTRCLGGQQRSYLAALRTVRGLDGQRAFARIG